jgi:hypothetical protein
VIIILLFIAIFIFWLLVSPVVLIIDSREPSAMLKWMSIGKAVIWYDDEWWLQFRVFFFQKKIRLTSLGNKMKATPASAAKKKKGPPKAGFRKLVRVMRTFHVSEWQIALDTGDYVRNAQLYPLNFIPHLNGHMEINFYEKNYLFIKLKNRPLKILYAFLH